MLPSACDFLVHHLVCVGHGACMRRVIYGIASSYRLTTHHTHALCITFLLTESVAKSKEKHKAPKRVAIGTSALCRSRWSCFVRDIWGWVIFGVGRVTMVTGRLIDGNLNGFATFCRTHFWP